ncbi:hypothetical protein PIB30_014314 [Stylosanthes scabra]|uniref:Uncharacterized protein n=1 Tax=Stylosanthes scabra TaxID=79078 RepID=A0ABU6Q6M1_9FABA|nr:hypothetical protein [Stylosanthes scabra]
MKLEEDEQLDPEFQAQIQQNSIPEFQEQESEAEFDGGDATTIQNATEIFQQQQIQLQQQTITSENSKEEEMVTKLLEGDDRVQSKTKDGAPTEMHKMAGDATGGFTFGSVGEWSHKARVIPAYRPPPKPPNLHSVTVGEGATITATIMAETLSCRIEDLVDPVNRIHRGAEDGAVKKGKVENDGAAMDDEDDRFNAMVGNAVTMKEEAAAREEPRKWIRHCMRR